MQLDDDDRSESHNGRDDAPENEDRHVFHVPAQPELPPPPDIQFSRPTLKSATPKTGVPAPYSPGVDPSFAGGTAKLGAGLSAGITFASSVIVGVLIGQWIDHKFNQSGMPWGTIVMALMGVAAGFLNFYRIVSLTDPKKKKPK